VHAQVALSGLQHKNCFTQSVAHSRSARMQ